MLKVDRRKNESFESMFRRFNRRMQLSGRKIQANKIRFFSGATSKNKQKTSTIRGLVIGEQRNYLAKVGRLKEPKRRGRRR